MFHLSDVEDLTSPYDTHWHLGTGQIDLRRLAEYVLPKDAIISLETDKDSRKNLDDFTRDVAVFQKFFSA